jgi:hypothetical protein
MWQYVMLFLIILLSLLVAKMLLEYMVGKRVDQCIIGEHKTVSDISVSNATSVGDKQEDLDMDQGYDSDSDFE